MSLIAGHGSNTEKAESTDYSTDEYVFVFMPATLIFVLGCGLVNGQSGWLVAMLGDFDSE